VDASTLRRPRRALKTFADACDVITFEFENIPADALDVLSRTTPLPRPPRAGGQPGPAHEKRFLTDLGLTTAPFAPIDNPGDLPAALAETGTPRS
jgi:5-(carboxyamino)imidazole ribonucleotide synthase